MFEVNQKPFSAIFDLLYIMEEVLGPFEDFYISKSFRGVNIAIRA